MSGEFVSSVRTFTSLIITDRFILVSGGFVSLPGGTSDLPSSLSSPVINTHAHEWKCLRFRYLIATDHVHDWQTVSLMVLLRDITSNETMQLFFTDKVTNEGRYIQTPLPRNYSNAQVGTH